MFFKIYFMRRRVRKTEVFLKQGVRSQWGSLLRKHRFPYIKNEKKYIIDSKYSSNI